MKTLLYPFEGISTLLTRKYMGIQMEIRIANSSIASCQLPQWLMLH